MGPQPGYDLLALGIALVVVMLIASPFLFFTAWLLQESFEVRKQQFKRLIGKGPQ